MSSIILDTDILIDVGRNIENAVSFLHEASKKYIPTISVITKMELIVGCRNKNDLIILEKFLNRFILLNVNEIISQKACEFIKRYRLSHGLQIA